MSSMRRAGRSVIIQVRQRRLYNPPLPAAYPASNPTERSSHMKQDLKTRHGGKILADALVAQGVKMAFGVPGESYLALLDGLHDVREQLAFVTCRQEGGASYMAEAYGKLTGEPGVLLVTRGPGA